MLRLIKGSIFLWGFLLLFISCQKKPTSSQFSSSVSDLENYGRYIITLQEGVDQNLFLDEYAVRPNLKFNRVINGFSASFSPEVFRAMSSDKRIKLIEPDLIVSLPPDFSFQAVPLSTQTLPAGIDRIDADLNPIAKIDTIDERVDIDVGIIDTGCDSLHPDLNVYRRVDFTGEGLMDGHGHGTHVAGTAAAIDNSIGVVGVAPGARLWSIKVLNSAGSGFWSWVIAGLDYATLHANEIEVVNLSLEGTGYLQSVQDAICKTVAAGIVVVVAAGNNGSDIFGADGIPYTADDFLPGCLTQCMTVSAMTDLDGIAGGSGGTGSFGADDALAIFSNCSKSTAPGNPVLSSGAGIDLAGPGVYVLSTFKGGGYAILSGTSMATPHITGAVALYIAQLGRAYDSLGVWRIRQALIDQGQAQTLWRADGATGDPDGNREALGYVGTTFGGPSNRPPVVNITSPANNSSCFWGDTVKFSGTATDYEDGIISTRIEWISDRDGILGNGAELLKSDLSVGLHNIKAQALDDSGATGASFVSLLVQEVPLLPPQSLSIIQLDDTTLKLTWLNSSSVRDWVLVERSDKYSNLGWTSFVQKDSVIADGNGNTNWQDYYDKKRNPKLNAVKYRLRDRRGTLYSDYTEIVRYRFGNNRLKFSME